MIARSAERGFVERLFVKCGETRSSLEDTELVDPGEVRPDGGRENIVVHFYAEGVEYRRQDFRKVAFACEGYCVLKSRTSDQIRNDRRRTS